MIAGGGRSLAVLALIFAGLAPALAQYPVKPVRLILPFPPGGGTDTLGRQVAQKMAEQMGQQVIADNRPGAGANLGVEIAVKSPPDGYTMVMVTLSNAVGQTAYSRLSFDLVKDLSGIARLATIPHVLVVHPSVPVKSVKEYVAFTRARPGQLLYSSSGAGSAAHIAGEYFASLTGVKMVHVPYKGGGPSMIALVGGEVGSCFATMPSAIGFIKSGKLRGVAVTTAERSPATPDLPTIAEAGVKGYEFGAWYALAAPANTPKEAISRLNAEAVKAIKHPDVVSRLASAGYEVTTSSPDEYTRFVRSEVAKWGKVVKAIGLRVD
ncbi:MAG: tripartite tricarboxylate transporter substrate binding protein [Burkholderiales bacterium]|nr:tripartite tricarboxylate transporter substrate binding protein [Burkholderiales bacterium]